MPAKIVLPAAFHQQLRVDYEAGASIQKLANLHGYSYGTIHTWLTQAGVTFRYRASGQRGWPNPPSRAPRKRPDRDTENAARARTRARRLRLTAANGGVAPIQRHDRSTYKNWGCRCVPCRTDHAKAQRALKARRWALTAANGGIAPTKTHNANTRTNWGCTCTPCRDDATRRRLARKRKQS